jgi:hypothetical protein
MSLPTARLGPTDVDITRVIPLGPRGRVQPASGAESPIRDETGDFFPAGWVTA